MADTDKSADPYVKLLEDANAGLTRDLESEREQVEAQRQLLEELRQSEGRLRSRLEDTEGELFRLSKETVQLTAAQYRALSSAVEFLILRLSDNRNSAHQSVSGLNSRYGNVPSVAVDNLFLRDMDDLAELYRQLVDKAHGADGERYVSLRWC